MSKTRWKVRKASLWVPAVLCEFGPDRNQLVDCFRKIIVKNVRKNCPLANLGIMENSQQPIPIWKQQIEVYRKRILFAINWFKRDPWKWDFTIMVSLKAKMDNFGRLLPCCRVTIKIWKNTPKPWYLLNLEYSNTDFSTTKRN